MYYHAFSEYSTTYKRVQIDAKKLMVFILWPFKYIRPLGLNLGYRIKPFQFFFLQSQPLYGLFKIKPPH